MLAQNDPERILNTALDALTNAPDWRSVLDELPAPIYTADAQGAVTYWNRACVEFAGRQPQLGKDRWCVSWKIYTTSGDLMPHDRCPMAETIRRREPIRGEIAIALRPDGTRVAFRPYPTPLFDADGQFNGAINMLIDVSEQQAEVLNDQAERCRRLAGATYNREMSGILGTMADEFQRSAEELDKKRG
jgi:PAS domain S-box-containing protein